MYGDSEEDNDFEDFEIESDNDDDENENESMKSEDEEVKDDDEDDEDDEDEEEDDDKEESESKSKKIRSSESDDENEEIVEKSHKANLKERARLLMKNLEKSSGEKDPNEATKKLFLPVISHPNSKTEIHRNSYLYYASSEEMYEKMNIYVDYKDRTLEIKDFERTCSLPQLKGGELVRLWEEREKDRLKKIIIEKKEGKNGGGETEERDNFDIPIDKKKDIFHDNVYENLKANLESSNPLNSYEYYKELFTDFCNDLDQDPEIKIDPKDQELDLPKERFKAQKEERGLQNSGNLIEKRGMIIEASSNQATPHNNLEYMLFNNYGKSPMALMSPHSSNVGPMDSFHSFNTFSDPLKPVSTTQGDSLMDQGSIFGGGGNFKLQQTSNLASIRGDEFVPRLPTKEGNQGNEKEYKICEEFQDHLTSLESEGKLPLLVRSSRLDQKNYLSENSLFSFKELELEGGEMEEENIKKKKGGDKKKETGKKKNDGKSRSKKKPRQKQTVYLDYTKPNLPTKKILKVEGKKMNLRYVNEDIVYSTWYEDINKEMNEGSDDTSLLGKRLLIDMNDKGAVYSKLIERLKSITKKSTKIKDKIQDNEFDLAQALENMGNSKDKEQSKLISKFLNQKKKELRLIMAKLSGGPEGFQKMQKKLQKEILKGGDRTLMKLLRIPSMAAMQKGPKKVTRKRRKITNYNHSQIANLFQYNILKMAPGEVKQFHRYDMTRKIINDMLQGKSKKWKVKIVNDSKSNYPLKNMLEKRRALVDANSKEIHDSNKIFKKIKRLSLRNDDFFLFEYIEKEPLMLGNVGMNSRLTRYYYPNRIARDLGQKYGDHLKEKEVVKKFKESIEKKFGAHGEEMPLGKSEKIPLLGQLTDQKCSGVTIMENNMYKIPVFKQKVRKTDFILVRTIEKGKEKYYLRRIKNAYSVGQIQPKLEVFCPYSRQFRSFLKKLMKYYIKRSFNTQEYIHLNSLKEILPSINDHNLRKNIKMLGGEQDHSDSKLFHFNDRILEENRANDYADEMDVSITPEELCLYERMYQSYYHLMDFGIQHLKSSDKISVIKTKFYRRNSNNPRKCVIARRIIEELYLSAWNISQCFLSAVQTQGRMYLRGYGDPTNGHGGMNFIKKPLKISRYESQLFRKAKKGKQNQMVTGTGADLRTLGMKFVHRKLKEHGYTEEILAGLERWDKIDLLREISNKQAQGGGPIDKELLKFSRNMRMTTKMQKEKYQSDINRMLKDLINNLSNIEIEKEIESDDEMDLVEDFDKLLTREDRELQKYRNLDIEDDTSQFSDNMSDNRSDLKSLIARVDDIQDDITFD